MSAPFTGPYDCDAHRSINLSQRQIANTKTISEILALLFCKVDGLGAALVPGEDGNRHAVRLHAQDGALGRSGHLLHRENYRSHKREVAYVLAIASHEQAVWQLVRGTSRTEVQLTAGNMYLLVFGASANAMAMHGVGNLSQRVWPLSERYGRRQRYSLSGSAQYAQGAGPADVLQWLESQTRFGAVHAISARNPCDGHVSL